MSEPTVSEEAAVAGIAAAAAVEEFQSREETETVAEFAAIEATTASSVAVEAVETAERADMAAETAVEASMTAVEAVQETAELSYATAQQLADMRQDYETQLSEIRTYIDSRVPVVEEPESMVEEVDVSSGFANNSGERTGTGEEAANKSTGEEGSDKSSQTQKRTGGLRHRRNRR